MTGFEEGMKMFITMGLGKLVRAILLVLATFVVLFLALANSQTGQTDPPPPQPAPTEKAHALQWDRLDYPWNDVTEGHQV
jgi:hypothetical protein